MYKKVIIAVFLLSVTLNATNEQQQLKRLNTYLKLTNTPLTTADLTPEGVARLSRLPRQLKNKKILQLFPLKDLPVLLKNYWWSSRLIWGDSPRYTELFNAFEQKAIALTPPQSQPQSAIPVTPHRKVEASAVEPFEASPIERGSARAPRDSFSEFIDPEATPEEEETTVTHPFLTVTIDNSAPHGDKNPARPRVIDQIEVNLRSLEKALKLPAHSIKKSHCNHGCLQKLARTDYTQQRPGRILMDFRLEDFEGVSNQSFPVINAFSLLNKALTKADEIYTCPQELLGLPIVYEIYQSAGTAALAGKTVSSEILTQAIKTATSTSDPTEVESILQHLPWDQHSTSSTTWGNYVSNPLNNLTQWMRKPSPEPTQKPASPTPQEVNNETKTTTDAPTLELTTPEQPIVTTQPATTTNPQKQSRLNLTSATGGALVGGGLLVLARLLLSKQSRPHTLDYIRQFFSKARRGDFATRTPLYRELAKHYGQKAALALIASVGGSLLMWQGMRKKS